MKNQNRWDDVFKIKIPNKLLITIIIFLMGAIITLSTWIGWFLRGTIIDINDKFEKIAIAKIANDQEHTAFKEHNARTDEKYSAIYQMLDILVKRK